MDTVPLELVEQIIHRASSGLNPSDLSSTLRSFSLVSHTWKHIAQLLLLSKFIRYGWSYNQIKLHQTLLSYPHLRDLVSCVWVDIGRISKYVDMTGSGLNSLLDLYRQLNQNSHFHHIVIKDRFERSRTQDILSLLASSTNITVLSCCRIAEYPIEIFYHCISVREVHIYHSSFSCLEHIGDDGLEGVGGLGCRLDDSGTHQNLSSNRRPHLLHLYLEPLSGDEDILKWFLHPNCAFDLSELKTLDFHDDSCEPGSFQRVREMVTRASSSLEKVGFHPSLYVSEEITNPEYAAFAPLPRLKCLKISLYGDGNFWPWATQLLSSLSHPEHLEELQLAYTLPQSGSEPLLLGDQAHGWEALDLCLTTFTSSSAARPHQATHRKFLNLETVIIGLVAREWAQNGEIRSRKLAEEIPVILPRLSALKLVKVSFSNVSGFIHNSDCWYIA